MCIGANACKKLHNEIIIFNWSNNMIDPIDYIGIVSHFMLFQFSCL
jgi:hypothetical protein